MKTRQSSYFVDKDVLFALLTGSLCAVTGGVFWGTQGNRLLDAPSSTILHENVSFNEFERGMKKDEFEMFSSGVQPKKLKTGWTIEENQDIISPSLADLLSKEVRLA